MGESSSSASPLVDLRTRQMHEERMQSFDRIAESQLPAGYPECWVNERGEFILSLQSGFDPNVGDTSHWLKMERRDPMHR